MRWTMTDVAKKKRGKGKNLPSKLQFEAQFAPSFVAIYGLIQSLRSLKWFKAVLTSAAVPGVSPGASPGCSVDWRRCSNQALLASVCVSVISGLC